MVFNGLKFECIKYGTNELLKTQYDYIDPTNSNSIMDKPVIRDLGIQMDLSGQFETHIFKTISKAKQKCGWVNRAFHNKSITLRRKLWRSYIEPVLDYGSQVYCPINPKLIAQLDTVQRSYTYFT